MKSIILGLVAIVIIGGLGYLVMPRGGGTEVSSQAKEQAQRFTNDLYSDEPGQDGAPAQVPNSAQEAPQGTMPSTTSNEKFMKATLKTNQGDITIDFMETDAPNTVANFAKLAKEGFYNGT